MFFVIFFLALLLRLYGIDWDQQHHLHPDERMIIMVADRLHLPKTPGEWQTVTTPDSPLNPKFFAYGSFPIYVLKGVSAIFHKDNYGDMLYVGRWLSILFELGTVTLIFLIAKNINPKLKARNSKQIQSAKSQKHKFGFWNLDFICHLDFGIWIFPLLAAFFYAISVLPIQSSHFFISDIPLTFLTTLVLYLSLRLILNSPAKGWYLILNTLLGIAFGLSLATKITAILLIVPILTALVFSFIKNKKFLPLIFSFILIMIIAGITFAIAMPYGIIDFVTFKAHTLEQSRMRVDPFVFPFTLQYVDTTPYWYFVKNIILWGMGLPLGLITIIGTIYTLLLWFNQIKLRLVNKQKLPANWLAFFILFIFFIIYFAFMGKSAVKFMRYMLPIYPLLCLFGSFFVFQMMQKLKLRSNLIILIICLISFIWPLAFISVYARTHTRIAASEWMYDNIPDEAKLATEHWDDGMPLGLPNRPPKRFNYLELPLYEADTPQKWSLVNSRLEQADYIVIASNRLYVPLMRLTDCSKYPIHRCYPLTADYYKKLFSNQLGFIKVAEFTSYPQLSILNYKLSINDDFADESFTVYDHPKIMIFRKATNI